MSARETALNAVETNPPQSVSQGGATSGSENVTPDDLITVSRNQGRPQQKRGNKQEFVGVTQMLQNKQTRDGETSNANKRPPAPTRDTIDTSIQTRSNEKDASYQRRNTEISSRSSSFRQASWLREDFQFPIT